MKITGWNTKFRTSTESTACLVADLLEAINLAAASCGSHGRIQGVHFKSITLLPTSRLIYSMYSYVPVAKAVALAGSPTWYCTAFPSFCPGAGVAPRKSHTVRTERACAVDVGGRTRAANNDADRCCVTEIVFEFFGLREPAALFLTNLPFLSFVSLPTGGRIGGRSGFAFRQGL